MLKEVDCMYTLKLCDPGGRVMKFSPPESPDSF